ncbi:hypothetical protein ACOSQ2_003998 [Xanthoceras sorbifolium]
MARGFAAPDADVALRRLKEKKKGMKKAQSSGLSEQTMTPPPPSRGKDALDMNSVGKASVDLVFPQDSSTYSDFRSIMPQVEQLLLPKDESQLKEMGLRQAIDWGLSHQFQVMSCDL